VERFRSQHLSTSGVPLLTLTMPVQRTYTRAQGTGRTRSCRT